MTSKDSEKNGGPYTKNEDWKGYDMESLVAKQLQRFELQRGEVIEELDKELESKDRINFRKLLINIDDKITQIIMKIMFHKKESIMNNLDGIPGVI